LDLVSPRLYSTLLYTNPFHVIEKDYDEIFSVVNLYKNIIDFKSRFTTTHSTGVAECAAILSRLFGLTDEEINQIRLAGYFHDLGNLAIPNAILEKPGKLTKEELAVIRQHPYLTYSVLNSIQGFEYIAEIAAFHHERLDGAGYPFHIGAEQLNTGARIMAVSDMFTALAEDRPHRKGMKREKIVTILRSQADNNAIDKRIVDLLIENFEEISNHVKAMQIFAHEECEMVFSNISAEKRPDSKKGKEKIFLAASLF